jgi:hypothetical protein
MERTSRHVTQPAGTGRRRLLPGFLRSVSPSAVAVTVSLLIGGAGFADAATGGTFILGKANKETSTASLADTRGTPLALYGPAGKAPLAVNRKVLVKNLNAQYLGGLTVTGLAVTGGEGYTKFGMPTSIGSTAKVVVSTGRLPAGTYYVSATALIVLATGDTNGSCWIATASDPANMLNAGLGEQGEFSVAETAAVQVTAGDTLEEICDAGGNHGSATENAGIIAIRVLFSSHK